MHLTVVWIQEQELRRRLPLHEIDGTRIPVEMMTENWNQQDTAAHLNNFGINFWNGQAAKSPDLNVLRETQEDEGQSPRLLDRGSRASAASAFATTE